MRILMIAERLPPAIGGVERHVAGLARELAGRGHAVTLVAPSHAANLPPEEQMGNARVLRLPRAGPGQGRRDYMRAWRWWASHHSLLAQADLIHFHEVYALLHWFGPARLLCLGKPLYLTYHGYEMRYPIPARARLYRWLGARLTRGSICIGHYLVKWFGLRPAAVSYGAVTVQEPPPLPDTPRAIFVGRLAADTDLATCLQALHILRQKTGRSLPLTVCGDGPSRLALERLAAGKGVDTTFVGFVADPTPYLAHATHVFAPGYLAMLEAMSAARPVLSVYHNPVKKDYFRLMPGAEHVLTLAETPEELAGALGSMPDGDERIERARRFAAGWTWERLADTYLALWEAA